MSPPEPLAESLTRRDLCYFCHFLLGFLSDSFLFLICELFEILLSFVTLTLLKFHELPTYHFS